MFYSSNQVKNALVDFVKRLFGDINAPGGGFLNDLMARKWLGHVLVHSHVALRPRLQRAILRLQGGQGY